MTVCVHKQRTGAFIRCWVGTVENVRRELIHAEYLSDEKERTKTAPEFAPRQRFVVLRVPARSSALAKLSNFVRPRCSHQSFAGFGSHARPVVYFRNYRTWLATGKRPSRQNGTASRRSLSTAGPRRCFLKFVPAVSSTLCTRVGHFSYESFGSPLLETQTLYRPTYIAGISFPGFDIHTPSRL